MTKDEMVGWHYQLYGHGERGGKGEMYGQSNMETYIQFSSVASDSLGPHESQHARPPCPSPSPRVHSDSCPSSP